MDSNIDLAAYIERISAGWPALHVALARAGLAEAIENQVRSAQEEQERLAARAAALQAQRTAETEKALSLLDAAWVAAFPDLPDRVRTAIYDRNDFDTCADLIVPLPDLPGMAPMFVCLVRQWTGGGKNAFVVAKLQGDVIGQQYMRDNFPHNQPEYSSSIVAKSLEQLFFRAAYAGAQFAAWQAAHAEYAEDEAHQEAARAADERARTADSAADQAGQRAADAERQVEIERIIAWAKTDPAVLNLVRAFMAIEEERDAFRVACTRRTKRPARHGAIMISGSRSCASRLRRPERKRTANDRRRARPSMRPMRRGERSRMSSAAPTVTAGTITDRSGRQVRGPAPQPQTDSRYSGGVMADQGVVQLAVDPLRPPMVAAEAESPFGKCFFCAKPIFTAFVVFPVVHDRRGYQARAHTSCYPKVDVEA